ncbi:MAG TPA: SurA N-terminal domain-containing protein [Candidatus Aminicenantes bacterium]|nr:SurA N-terminal domain-containing protein [Candidatus Aminicenantes bacterium]HRY64728.1 SurA N-terminal domain-containing protein [Candidatus Aminicenantes bacterium]HRZ71641.1 SurA N-terminal domain-containing protein [Candidatus Aminicenantes bacterium]
MLKTMRRNVKSLKPILWIVVATFVVAIFAIWGGAGRLGESNRTDTLATVGGARISSDEFYQALRQRLEAIRKQLGGEINAGLIQQLGVPQQTLEQLVQQRLLLEIASDMGLRASDAEVRAKIMSFPGLQQDGKFVGFENYKRALEYNHIQLAEFEASLRQDVLLGKVVDLLTAGLFVTDDEVWESYRKQNDSVKIEYVVAETAKIEAPAAGPSEAQLRARYDGNAAAYKVAEKRTADYVVLRQADFKKEIKVKDEEVEKYYRDNTAQFQEPETVKASRIWLPFTAADKDKVLAQAGDLRRRAAGGEDFAALARANSKDDKAAAGGDWGAYDWRSLSAAETAAVSGLDKDAVSEVVETETGAAVFKVTDKTAAVTKPLDEVKTTIKAALEDEKARALVAERLQSLEKAARKEKSLDVAAQKQGYKPASTGALKRGDPLGDFDTSGAVSEALFGLKEKEISAPIVTYAGEVLAELKAVEPERPAKFEEVRDQLVLEMTDELKRTAARDRLREIRASLKEDWHIEAPKLKLEYKSVDAHKKEQYLSLVGERSEIDALLFSLPLKQASEPVAVDEGYAIFRVLDRKASSREEFEKVKATERETLLGDKKNRFLMSYMTKAREEKKVKINAEAYQRLSQDVLSRYSGQS